MITYKSSDDIKIMQHGGKILHDVIKFAEKAAQVGMSTTELDKQIEEFILERGAEPGFKRVEGYKWASCLCVNEYIVHTPPSERVLEDGDVLTIDIGVYYKGLHTDSATTVQVGTQDPKITVFLETGRRALKKALAQAKIGKRVGDISHAFQKEIEGVGYSIIVELTGHGVGKELHEDPSIPCYLDRPIERTHLLKPGMTLALEVMYAMGRPKIEHASDGWSIKMADKSVSATFEHSVALTENGTIILT